MKTIRNYFWQFASTLLALIAIFATYNVFFLGQAKKGLQVTINPPVSLVDVKPEAVKDIQVLYKGAPIDKALLIQVQIENTGNQPISETDFSRPLSFSFPAEYKLLDATVVSSEPANVGMTITKVSEQVAQASAALLNQGDTVTFSFIIIGSNGDALPNKLVVDGRILGIKEIKKVSSTKQSTPDLRVALGLGIIASILSSIIYEFLKQIPNIFKSLFASKFAKKTNDSEKDS
ncbi:MAG: hypothetical protein IPP66_17720 [Anaerolineales bacterium]|nr:hypothetical protein [Anaerolineales bacterium]